MPKSPSEEERAAWALRTAEIAAPSPIPLQEFTCERCGFVYSKQFDFQPFLCYRCMRFIAKRVYTTMITITPLGRTEREDI